MLAYRSAARKCVMSEPRRPGAGGEAARRTPLRKRLVIDRMVGLQHVPQHPIQRRHAITLTGAHVVLRHRP